LWLVIRAATVPVSGRPQGNVQPVVSAQAQAARRWAALLSVGVGAYLAVVDGSFVNAILPSWRRVPCTTSITRSEQVG